MAADETLVQAVGHVLRHRGHRISQRRLSALHAAADGQPFAFTAAVQRIVADDDGTAREQLAAIRRQQLDAVARHMASASSGSITCRGCGSAQVSVQQKQTRAADEGMTVFCACDGCGKQWRMG